MSYRKELLKRGLDRGVGQFFRQGFFMAISFGPWIPVVGFKRDCQDNLRVEDSKRSGVSFQNYNLWKDVPTGIKESLNLVFQRSQTQPEVMLTWGWQLWIGSRCDKLAIIGWTRSHLASHDFFFPISDNEVLIWHTETLPEHRGFGLLPLMLDYMVQTLGSEGIRTAYGTCAVYNESSRKGIEKAHFKLIGHGIMRAGTGRGLVWLQRHSENCINSNR